MNIKFVLLILLCCSLSSYGQIFLQVAKTQNFRQTTNPEMVDNYMYSTYYTNGKNIFNLKGFKLSSNAKIIDFKVNPSGFSYAVASGDEKKSSITIYDIADANKVLHKIKDISKVSAICYSADSRNLYVAVQQQGISVFETKGYSYQNQIPVSNNITAMSASSNGYFIAATTIDHNVLILNLQNNSLRLSIPSNKDIKCVRFSPDATRLGVLTSNKLKLYNTINFQEDLSIDGFDNATSFDFHPEGKYVTLASDDKVIGFYNMIDKSEKATLIDAVGKIDNVRFLNDAKLNTYLSYTTPSSVMYKIVKGLAPHYTKMMRDQLNARMMEWCRRLPGETDDEFNRRVNEETITKQKKLFANEISTRLATEFNTSTEVKLGNYNPSTGMLTLIMENMGPVLLKVPQADLAYFDDPNNLEFTDVQYGLTQNDTFEMIYAKVRNKRTGKEYLFDNLERQSFDFLLVDDNFVPLEFMQQAGKEDVALQLVANDIVNKARQNNLITDHTNINVNTSVVPSYDANGKRINNYNVSFDYKVEANYSFKEDFAAGRYKIEESHAAMSMLAIVVKAFSTDFEKYIVPGKKLIISVTGTADAIPVKGTIAYDGSYGIFQNEPYYVANNLSNITVTKSTGIKSNEQLAFMRAQGVTSYLNKNLSAVSSMDAQYKYNVELSEHTGGEFRRISVIFTFVDAF